MKLIFLRHGIAEDRAPDGTDFSRRLTDKGEEEMRREADALARIGLKPGIILTSPLVRAAQTAEIVAHALGMADRVREEPRLAGFSLEHLRTVVTAHSDRRSLMLVGHEPSFSTVVGQLIGGANVRMKKGGLAIVEADAITIGSGTLLALVPPAMLLRGSESE